MCKYFLSKLEIVKLFGCDKYRSTLFYEITIKNMERENENEKKIVFFKSFYKIVIEYDILSLLLFLLLEEAIPYQLIKKVEN